MTSPVLFRVLFVVLHQEPHLDEITAYLLLLLFGEKFFPGVSTAPVIFWPADSVTPDGRPAAEWEKKGYLMIGVGGGRFDEHPSSGEKRKVGECATTLVARALGVYTHPELRKIIDLVSKIDLEGNQNGQKDDHPLFQFANMITAAHAATFKEKGSPQETLQRLVWLLRCVYLQQVDFVAAAEDIKYSTVVEEIKDSKGYARTVATVLSNNREAKKHACWKQGAEADVVILRQTKDDSQNIEGGHTQILLSTKYKDQMDCMDSVAAAIRTAERFMKKKTGEVLPDVTLVQLMAEGKVAGAREWHYFSKGKMLLNGSHTNYNDGSIHTRHAAPPTKLTHSQVSSLVIGVIEGGLKKIEEIETLVREVCE